ncbi:hypothetical protein B5G52_01055 [Pseudoalteromonas sp. A601]|uniref:hypothetical protein n=1 Tax=Pseudoalteromonas sp. A601 TaxID=1967839 RepID=UPI000B3CCC34|nr:hypothetical protein [Pseudoalteromonas sp. A601]OUS74617.1 hypothetical protein B5G52_01055 [Pseudoalteromonas sp. A601]
MFAFFSSQVKQLQHLKVRQRQHIIAVALSMLSPLQKISLRIVKLLLLTPVFASLIYIEGWLMLAALLVAGLSYPLLTTPVEIAFAKPFIADALKQQEGKQGEY